MEDKLYYYKAIVKKVVDGDTIELNVDCGFDMWLNNVSCRLARINAYEIKLGSGTTAEMKAKGLEAKQFVISLIENKEIIIKSSLDKEKYGRILAEIFYLSAPETYTNLNDLLVSKGYAIFQQY
jgi:micrococcal nuclease